MVADLVQTKWLLEWGVSRFVQELSDNTTDAPLTPTWFFKLVVGPMMDAGRLNLTKLKWLQPDDDIFAVGGHIQLIALITAHLKRQLGEEAKAIDQVKSALGQNLKTLIEKMEEMGEDKDELRSFIEETDQFKKDS